MLKSFFDFKIQKKPIKIGLNNIMAPNVGLEPTT